MRGSLLYPEVDPWVSVVVRGSVLNGVGAGGKFCGAGAERY